MTKIPLSPISYAPAFKEATQAALGVLEGAKEPEAPTILSVLEGQYNFQGFGAHDFAVWVAPKGGGRFEWVYAERGKENDPNGKTLVSSGDGIQSEEGDGGATKPRSEVTIAGLAILSNQKMTGFVRAGRLKQEGGKELSVDVLFEESEFASWLSERAVSREPNLGGFAEVAAEKAAATEKTERPAERAQGAGARGSGSGSKRKPKYGDEDI